MRRFFMICFCLAIVSCEKEKKETYSGLYASITVDDFVINYNEKDSVYSRTWSRAWGITNHYESGFTNSEYIINNHYNTIYDILTIKFQNIPFDSIKPGMYNYLGRQIIGKYDDVGVEITWMNPETWEIIGAKYFTSNEYSNCIKTNSEDKCSNLLSRRLFMNSKTIASSSQLEVTEAYLIDSEAYSFEDDIDYPVKDLIVEGIISDCKIASMVDTSYIMTMNGEFRIQLPAPDPGHPY